MRQSVYPSLGIGLVLLLLMATGVRAAGYGLVNPGFETGNLTGWTGWPTPQSCSVATSSTAHEGSHLARIQFNSAVNMLVQDINAPATLLIPGTTYVVTAWCQYQTSSATDFPILTLCYYDGSALAGPFLQTHGQQGPRASWTPIRIWFSALDHPRLRISLQGGGSAAAAGTAVFDDVSLAEAPAPTPPLDIYLLLGQSNMVGMDKNFNEADQTPDPHVFTFTTANGWAPSIEPLHGVGIGPGLVFGKAMAAYQPGRTIGLIPLAVGSTPISAWVKGTTNYNLALAKAQAAQSSGTLKGILWQQGESDSYDSALAAVYAMQLQSFVHDLRQDLDLPNVPFVCGELGQFLAAPYVSQVVQALKDLPAALPHTATVSSGGLSNMDEFHFNGSSARTLGQRYADAMIQLQGRTLSAAVRPWSAY